MDGPAATSGLEAYLGQYYELQDNTFIFTSPVYVTRYNASIWLYHNFSVPAMRLAANSISELTSFVSNGTKNLNLFNQSGG